MIRPRPATGRSHPSASLTGLAMRALAARGAVALAALVLTAPALAQSGDARRGEKLYAECIACHAMQEGVQGVGPSLAGIAGRRAAAIEGFRYSPALRRASIAWTAQNLDAFIADPQKLIPGNRMPYSGLAQERDRADLVAWLMRDGR